MSSSFFPPTANQVRSPKQATTTFSQVGGLPRQRNVFLIKFIPLQPISGIDILSFAVKSIDRPRVNPKTEELNQYNKKRQIFTGYKLEPVRVQFFDSGNGSAQNMWTRYSRFYFGDLNQQAQTPSSSNFSYSYDQTLGSYKDFTGSGFGFTAKNGGGDTDAQFFFDRVEIYHFYDGFYDLYQLGNPKISAFEPDDLDYENSGIGIISATLVYENLQYFPQQQVASNQFTEFSTAFNGDPLLMPDSNFPTTVNNSLSFLEPGNPSIATLLNSGTSGFGGLDFRFGSSPSTGGLGLFGNFSFGPTGISAGAGLSLSTMSLGNPALAAALSLGVTASSIGGAAVSAGIQGGINGALYDVLNARPSLASTGFGTGQAAVTGSLLAANAINGGGASVNSSGQISLPPDGYGAYNANQTGTSQIGINTGDSQFSQDLPTPPIPPPTPPDPPPDSGGFVVDDTTA